MTGDSTPRLTPKALLPYLGPDAANDELLIQPLR